MSSPNFVFGPKANSLRKASEYAILLEVIQWKKCENTVLNRNFADIQKFITSEWNTVLQRFFLGKICLDVFFISYFRTESRSLEKKSPKLQITGEIIMLNWNFYSSFLDIVKIITPSIFIVLRPFFRHNFINGISYNFSSDSKFKQYSRDPRFWLVSQNRVAEPKKGNSNLISVSRENS